MTVVHDTCALSELSRPLSDGKRKIQLAAWLQTLEQA